MPPLGEHGPCTHVELACPTRHSWFIPVNWIIMQVCCTELPRCIREEVPIPGTGQWPVILATEPHTRRRAGGDWARFDLYSLLKIVPSQQPSHTLGGERMANG